MKKKNARDKVAASVETRTGKDKRICRRTTDSVRDAKRLLRLTVRAIIAGHTGIGLQVL